MFDRVMHWLESDPAGHDAGFDEHDVRVAIAALFYHMIAIDGVVKENECAQMRALLTKKFSLSENQLKLLSKEGEDRDRSSAGLFPFSIILNRELPVEERVQVIRQLSELAEVDGEIHPLEASMIEHMRALLKV